jgi:hypothetical protein
MIIINQIKYKIRKRKGKFEIWKIDLDNIFCQEEKMHTCNTRINAENFIKSL